MSRTRARDIRCYSLCHLGYDGSAMVADVTWKLELCSSSAHNGPTARITALAGPLQCIHQGPGRSEPEWTEQDSYSVRKCTYLYYSTATQPEKGKTGIPRKGRLESREREDWNPEKGKTGILRKGRLES